jgi:hypothetical protein
VPYEGKAAKGVAEEGQVTARGVAIPCKQMAADLRDICGWLPKKGPQKEESQKMDSNANSVLETGHCRPEKYDHEA